MASRLKSFPHIIALLYAACILLFSIFSLSAAAEGGSPPSPKGTFTPPSDIPAGAVAHLPTAPLPVPSVQKSGQAGPANRKTSATSSLTIGTWLTFWTGRDYSGSYATYYAPTPPRGCYDLPTPFRGSIGSIRIQWNARDGNPSHAICGRITYRYKSGCAGNGTYWEIPGGVTDPTRYDYADVWYGSFNGSEKAILSVECGPATSAPPESCNPCQYIMCPTNSKCYNKSCDPICYCNNGYMVSNGQCVPILAPNPPKLSPPMFKPPSPPPQRTTFPSPPKVQNPPPKSLTSPTTPPASPNAPRPPSSLNPPSKFPPSSPVLRRPPNPPPSPLNRLPPSGGAIAPPPPCDPCASKKCPNNSKCYNENCVGLCYCNDGYIVVNKKCALPPSSPPSPPPRPPRPPPAPKAPPPPCNPCKSVFCPNNSKCVNQDCEAYCYCNTGYVVRNGKCVLPSPSPPTPPPALKTPSPPSPPCNPCLSATCPKNSQCRNNSCDAWCFCDTGFFYKDGKCVRPFPNPPAGGNPGPPSSCSPCTSTTCPPNSQCTTVDCKSVCTCNTGYVRTNNGSCLLPPPNPSPPMGEDLGCLAPHNAARAAVGIPSLRWNATLFRFAQTWANSIRDTECSFDFSPYPYGENIYMTGDSQEPTCKAAVDVWVSEKAYYNYATNSCIDGETCEDYTQIVWKATTDVGCAKATCADNVAYIWVCEYNPPGNYEGQRPY